MTIGCRYDYPADRAGDTIKAKRITVTRNGSPEPLGDVSIRIHLKNSDDSIIEDFNIIPSGNEFDIPSFTAPPAGEYKYDVQFTYPDGSIQTYIYGKIFTSDDVTKNG